MDDEKIRELVKQKYPKHPDENHCWQTRQRMNELREAYRQRLLNEKGSVETEPGDLINLVLMRQ
jgi:hypothetical protein